jgi:ribosomal 30S subunit maturation factor RimM
MKYPGLVGIGRLGGRDAEGFHHAMIKPEYRSVFTGLKEIYLIFNSDRVFYVTISDRKESDRKTWIKLLEDGISEEQKKSREVLIAMSAADFGEDEDRLDHLLGFSVINADTHLGKVEDYFFNGAQQVLQVLSETGTEYLIPFVDYYIAEVLEREQSIKLQNADDLIAFYALNSN